MNSIYWQNGLTKRLIKRIEVIITSIFCIGIGAISLSEYPVYVVEYIIYGLCFLAIIKWAMRRNRSISIFVYLTMHTFGYLFFIPVIISQHKIFRHPGWLSIGSFEIGKDSFTTAMFCSLGFLVSVSWLTIYLDQKFFHFKALNLSEQPNELKDEKKILRKDRDIILVSFFICMNMLVTIFMFERQIGITGIETGILPYKLAGILYYYRLLVLPIIYMLLAKRVIFWKRWWMIATMLFISANLFAVTSGSKGILVIYMGPVISILLLKKKFIAGGILSGLTFILLPFYSGVRNLLYPLHYEFGYSTYDISQLGLIYNYLVERFLSEPYVVFEYGLVFIGRAMGIRELLMSTYTNVKIEDPQMFVSGFLDIIPDKIDTMELTGLVIDSEKGFGAGVDIISYIALASPSVAWALLFTVVFVIVLLSLEKLMRISLGSIGVSKELSYLILTLLFLRYIQRLDSLPSMVAIMSIASLTICWLKGKRLRRDLL